MGLWYRVSCYVPHFFLFFLSNRHLPPSLPSDFPSYVRILNPDNAMSAVLYLRVLRDIDFPRVSLLTAKSKVTSLKRQTIPQLWAAVLLVRFVINVRKILNEYSNASEDKFECYSGVDQWFAIKVEGFHRQPSRIHSGARSRCVLASRSWCRQSCGLHVAWRRSTAAASSYFLVAEPLLASLIFTSALYRPHGSPEFHLSKITLICSNVE